MKIENIYRFLAALSVTQEQLMYCKDDLIKVHKANINLYIASALNRHEARQRQKDGEQSLKSYIAAIERLYNTGNKILSQIENDKDGSSMMDQMIDKLTESLNEIKIEVKDEQSI